jgi:hypothetical protein
VQTRKVKGHEGLANPPEWGARVILATQAAPSTQWRRRWRSPVVGGAAFGENWFQGIGPGAGALRRAGHPLKMPNTGVPQEATKFACPAYLALFISTRPQVVCCLLLVVRKQEEVALRAARRTPRTPRARALLHLHLHLHITQYTGIGTH